MSAFKDPIKQIVPLIFVVTLLYAYLARPVETVTDLVKLGDYVYLTAGPVGLRIIDVRSENLELVGALLTEDYAMALEVKEMLIGEQLHRMAYIADRTEGVDVVDVTNPAHPVSLQHASGDTVLNLALWNDYLYAATGYDGVILFKILPDGKLEKVKNAHLAGEIEQLTATQNRLYVMDGETLQVHSLAGDPIAPPNVGSYPVKEQVNDIQVVNSPTGQQVYLAADRSGVIGLTVTQPVTPTAKLVISNTLKIDTPGRAMSVIRYDQNAVVADGKKGVRVYDISQTSPVAIGFFETWNKTSCILADPQTSQLYVGDGVGGLRRLDLLSKMKTTQDGAIPEAQAAGMAYAAPYLFVANGGQGVRVLGQGASGEWVEVAFYDTPGKAQAVQVRPRQAMAFVADGSQLVALELNDLYSPSNPAQAKTPQVRLLGKLEAGTDANLQDIRLSPDRPLAFLAAGKGGLWVVDTRNPQNMAVLGKEQAGEARRLDIARDHAFVATGDPGVHIINVRDDHYPTRVDTIQLQGKALGVAVWDYDINQPVSVYVAAGESGLCTFQALGLAASQPQCLAAGTAEDVVVNPYARQVYVVTREGLFVPFSLEDPLHPRPLDPANLGRPLSRVILDGAQVFASAGAHGLRWIDLADRSQPVGEFDFAQRINQFVKQGKYIFAVNGPQGNSQGNNIGLRILEEKQPGQAQEIGRFRSTPDTKGGAAYAVTLHPSGNPAYLADGANGLRVLDVSNPTQPRLAQTLVYGLDARHFWVDRLNPRRGFLVLGTGDLVLVDLSNPFAPAVVKSTPACNPYPAVWVQSYRGDYAFVACQGAGVASVWVVDAARMGIADRFEEVRFVNNFSIMDPLDKLQMLPAALDPSFKDSYLLAAGDEDGMLVLNISKPGRLELPPGFEPVRDGPVSWIYSQDTYAFVAHGLGDVAVYSMFAPARPVRVSDFTAPDPQKPLGTTSLYAESLPVTDKDNPPIGYRIYAGSITNGLRWDKAIKEPKLEQAGLYETPGTASFGEVFNVLANRVNNAFVAISDLFKELHWGSLAQWVDEFRKMLADLVKGVVEFLGTSWPTTGVSPKAVATLNRVILGDFIMLGLGGMLLWAALFGQFALPVKGVRQRLQAASRLAAYLTGGHGTMARINDGRVYRGEDDATRRGPGVVLVDVTSAAVLEKRIHQRGLLIQALSRLTLRPAPSTRAPYGYERGEPLPPERVVGPGVVFTGNNPSLSNPKWDEVVLRAVDLRTQVRVSAEDVFALTMEGIEVKNRISCVFSLGQPPDVLLVTYAGGEHDAEALRVVMLEGPTKDNGLQRGQVRVTSLADELDLEDKTEIHQQVQAWRREGSRMQPYSEQVIREYTTPVGRPFIVDEQRVFAAAASHANVGSQEKLLEWYELPVRTAVKIYRDRLAQQPYDALYRPGDPTSFPLREMKTEFARAVRNQGVLAYQFIESDNDNTPLKLDQNFEGVSLRVFPITQLTNPKVLRSRGIRVIVAGFGSLKPVSAGVQQRLTENWRSRWEKHADQMRTEYQIQVMRIRSHARAEAQLDMVRSLSAILDAGAQSREALALRVFQALEATAADPLTRQMLPGETISMLQMLRTWLITEGNIATPSTTPGSGSGQNPP